jgi:prepilin-type N-terminal cleavage/methylation domain-containing protein
LTASFPAPHLGASDRHARRIIERELRKERRGFTLIEILVVLLVLALAASLAMPALLPSSPPAADPLRAAIGATRRAAVRRGESLTFALERDGRWLVTGDASPGAGPLLSGTLPSPVTASLRLRISPLGTCLPEMGRDASSNAEYWDPVRCDVADTSHAPRDLRPSR